MISWNRHLRSLPLMAFGLLTMEASFASTQVIFVNGIENTYHEALIAASRIQDVLDLSANHLSAKADFHVALKYNPNGLKDGSEPLGCNMLCEWITLTPNLEELFVQKAAEENFALLFKKILAPFNDSSPVIDQQAAATIVATAIDKQLSGSTSLENSVPAQVTEPMLAPNKIVVQQIVDAVNAAQETIIIAHSQGNLLANLAHAKLASQLRQDVRKRLRIINVANTTQFSVSGLNITHANDGALFNAAARFPLGDVSLETLPSRKGWTRTTVRSAACISSNCDLVLAAPTFGGVSSPGFLDHEFLATYLSSTTDLPQIIVDQGVQLTPNKTKFVDRFEDFVYAAKLSLDIESGSLNKFTDDFNRGNNGDPLGNGWNTGRTTGTPAGADFVLESGKATAIGFNGGVYMSRDVSYTAPLAISAVFTGGSTDNAPIEAAYFFGGDGTSNNAILYIGFEGRLIENHTAVSMSDGHGHAVILGLIPVFSSSRIDVTFDPLTGIATIYIAATNSTLRGFYDTAVVNLGTKFGILMGTASSDIPSIAYPTIDDVSISLAP